MDNLMKYTLFLLLVLVSSCNRDSAEEQWEIIESKDDLTVSVMLSSIQRSGENIEGWVKAAHSRVQTTEDSTVSTKYDHEIDRWSVNCGKAEFSIVKRVFYFKDRKVAEWPIDRRDEFGLITEMALPGTRSAAVVEALCRHSAKQA